MLSSVKCNENEAIFLTLVWQMTAVSMQSRHALHTAGSHTQPSTRVEIYLYLLASQHLNCGHCNITGLCAGVQGIQGVSLHSAGVPCPALHQLTGPAGGTRASDMITAAILTILQSTTQIAIISCRNKISIRICLYCRIMFIFISS